MKTDQNSQLSTVNSPLKNGYKQTEVGIIPEDWDARLLGSLTTLMTNGFVGIATIAYVDYEDGVLYVQGYNVKENGFNFHGIKRVSKSFHAKNKKSCLQSGDLLTIQTGDIGVTTIVPPSLAGANCHALVISRFDKRVSESEYYCQYFNSERGRIAFKEIETGSTMKHLNVGDMVKLYVPSPPLPEQRAIATALSDVDALLAAQDKLIAKKRDIKQAAMQQLLTGKQRLQKTVDSGELIVDSEGNPVYFSGEWEQKRIGDIFNVTAGGDFDDLRSSSFQDERYPFPVYSNAISSLGLYGYSDYADHAAGSITVTARGLVGVANFRNHRYTAIGRVIVLQPKEAGDGRFFAEYINERITFALETTGVPQLTAPQISSYELLVPPFPEQTAIAAVLSDMDADLAALEQQRDKTRALKQGMMQELLTGRIRLI